MVHQWWLQSAVVSLGSLLYVCADCVYMQMLANSVYMQMANMLMVVAAYSMFVLTVFTCGWPICKLSSTASYDLARRPVLKSGECSLVS